MWAATSSGVHWTYSTAMPSAWRAYAKRPVGPVVGGIVTTAPAAVSSARRASIVSTSSAVATNRFYRVVLLQ